MMHVQEVESRIFTKYLERLMDDMKIKTARQNSIKRDICHTLLYLNRQVDRTPPLT